MKNGLYQKAILADENTTGQRYCNQCQMHKKSKGGMWILSASGKQRRWMCLDCYTRKLERESK